jgi:hypothetical protein
MGLKEERSSSFSSDSTNEARAKEPLIYRLARMLH